MRFWTVTQLMFVFVLLISITSTGGSPYKINVYDTPLVTRIVSIEYDGSVSEVYSEFQITAVVEVWNQNEEPVTINHLDTCGFMISISSTDMRLNGMVYSSVACGAAITPETYDPGVTQTTTTAFFTLSETSGIPNGIYELTYGRPIISSAYEEVVSFIKTTMTVTDTSIVFVSDPLPEGWGTVAPAPVTIPNDQPGGNTKSTSYIVATNESGLTTTLFTKDQTSNNSGTNNGGTNEDKGNRDVPEVVSETLDFNMFWTFLTLGFISLTMIVRRRRIQS